MQREEKQMDATIDALIQRVGEIKTTIAQFIMKLEHEYTTMTWPNVLDNFALISGQINTLNRFLKNDKTPALRNHILLPLVLAPEPDLELEKLTESRVRAFNHEVVPDYLRTKPEPDIEEKYGSVTSRSTSLSTDNLQKQVNTLNKVSANLIEMVNSTREQWESDITKTAALPQTTSQADTQKLVSAVSFGKSLKPRRPEPVGLPGPMNHMPQQNMPMNQGMSPGHGQPHGPPGGYNHMYQGHMGMNMNPQMKMQSSMKGNIKSGGHNHPYGRP
ncbi:hypothetical protein CAPTEDRAFT_226423 [Capitella teleta]|uniref:Mediator of RNA polymerase II transcription subunit 8 n=1 Tax=Capitella teleta TaxID=283909 RepID=R7VIW7_CAPTE|nr:hypothetical protein CAPTEDRAFT_226423 [Capitella teleta]|eukprot:ELU16221.1 hypothetical protein CAPTEDRAFT_226423 [Capitella teleta]